MFLFVEKLSAKYTTLGLKILYFVRT